MRRLTLAYSASAARLRYSRMPELGAPDRGEPGEATRMEHNLNRALFYFALGNLAAGSEEMRDLTGSCPDKAAPFLLRHFDQLMRRDRYELALAVGMTLLDGPWTQDDFYFHLLERIHLCAMEVKGSDERSPILDWYDRWGGMARRILV